MPRKEIVRVRRMRCSPAPSRRAAPGAIALGFVLLCAAAARAQEQEVLVELTPRGAVRAFLEAGHHGRLGEATRLLSSEDRERADLAQAARQLVAVLDDCAPTELSSLSDAPEGRTDDHLPPTVEDVAHVPASDSHGTEPVRLTRSASGRWFFSASTVARVPVWYQDLPDRELRDRLPEWLMRPGPRGLARWQLAALLLLALGSVAFAWLLRPPMRWLARRFAARTRTRLDDHLAERLQGPAVLLVSTLVAAAGLPWLMLKPAASDFVTGWLTAIRLFAGFWSLLRTVDLAAAAAGDSPLLADKPEMKALLPLVTRTGKFALWGLAFVVVLQELGYPAASLVAGLGIGGLALALAAQKTVEHFFGSVTLSLDQPFRPGDLVRIDDVTGTVELVGIRSTRIRTAERTVVTFPNGRLAELRIESFAARDRLRVSFTLPLALDTPARVVEQVIADVRERLASHPRRHADPATVALASVGPGGLVVEATGWLESMPGNDFQKAREELLLSAIAAVEHRGARLHGAATEASGRPS
jgi:MscS family membrane protein